MRTVLGPMFLACVLMLGADAIAANPALEVGRIQLRSSGQYAGYSDDQLDARVVQNLRTVLGEAAAAQILGLGSPEESFSDLFFFIGSFAF